MIISMIDTFMLSSQINKHEEERKNGIVINKNITFKYTELDDEYIKRWNINSEFGHLYKNGIKMSDTLYRIGGHGISEEDKYFMILKYVEAKYNDNITTIIKDKFHLSGLWCILNENGEEKGIFDSYKSPYMVGGQVYVLDKTYYNIETKKPYCNSYSSMKTKKYLFLDNQYDEDIERRGVFKINMIDGTFEIFKEKE